MSGPSFFNYVALHVFKHFPEKLIKEACKDTLMKKLLIILIPVLIFSLSFSVLVFDEEYYDKLIEKTSRHEMGSGVSRTLISYFKTTDYGIIDMQGFTQDELEHLLDVKKILHGFFVFLILLTLTGLLMLYRLPNKDFPKTALYAGIITILIPVILSIIPFDILFALFHKPLFSEGTWLFPADACIINIYNEEFCYLFARRIFLQGILIGLLLIALFIHDKKSNLKDRFLSTTIIK